MKSFFDEDRVKPATSKRILLYLAADSTENISVKFSSKTEALAEQARAKIIYALQVMKHSKAERWLWLSQKIS